MADDDPFSRVTGVEAIEGNIGIGEQILIDARRKFIENLKPSNSEQETLLHKFFDILVRDDFGVGEFIKKQKFKVSEISERKFNKAVRDISYQISLKADDAVFIDFAVLAMNDEAPDFQTKRKEIGKPEKLTFDLIVASVSDELKNLTEPEGTSKEKAKIGHNVVEYFINEAAKATRQLARVSGPER